MITDSIKMFIAAFCAEKRLKLKITPDADAFDTAQFISLLSGRCEISEYQKAALIKPLKKRPATTCAIMVPHAGRELFFLIAGITAQLDIVVRFDCIEGKITPEELAHICRVTQDQLCCARSGNTIYLSSMMCNENPLFDECEIDTFSAGLCVGAVLARADTLVNVPNIDNNDLICFTLRELVQGGIDVYPESKSGNPIIRTILKTRLPEKKTGKTGTTV